MRLHYHPLSSYSRKVAIGVGLRGDPIDLHVLDVFGGELASPAFQAMNPFGKMPVLETDDGAIFESTTILDYLEERGPRRLIPEQHAWRVRHFDRLGDLYLLEPIGEYFWDKSADVREKAVATTAKAWAVFARELSDGRRFIAGSDITLADLSAAVAAHYATTEDLPLPDAILEYKQRLEEHPVVRASAEAALPFVERTRPRRTKA